MISVNVSNWKINGFPYNSDQNGKTWKPSVFPFNYTKTKNSHNFGLKIIQPTAHIYTNTVVIHIFWGCSGRLPAWRSSIYKFTCCMEPSYSQKGHLFVNFLIYLNFHNSTWHPIGWCLWSNQSMIVIHFAWWCIERAEIRKTVYVHIYGSAKIFSTLYYVKLCLVLELLK